MNEFEHGAPSPLDSGDVMKRARQISSDSLERMVDITNHGSETGSTSFTRPDVQIVIVERDGDDYVMYPLDNDGNVTENVYVSTKPTIDRID